MGAGKASECLFTSIVARDTGHANDFTTHALQLENRFSHGRNIGFFAFPQDKAVLSGIWGRFRMVISRWS